MGKQIIKVNKKEQLISFDTAKLAKEKGFDWVDDDTICGGYVKNGKEISVNVIGEDWEDYIIYTPTQSLLQKWLREEHDIVDLNIFPSYSSDKLEGYRAWRGLVTMSNMGEFIKHPIYNTYEEALEKRLHEVLKLIK